jgi:hypothetical protein
MNESLAAGEEDCFPHGNTAYLPVAHVNTCQVSTNAKGKWGIFEKVHHDTMIILALYINFLNSKSVLMIGFYISPTTMATCRVNE